MIGASMVALNGVAGVPMIGSWLNAKKCAFRMIATWSDVRLPSFKSQINK